MPFLTIDVTDEISPLAQLLLAGNPKWLRRISGNVGWFMQKEIKAGIKAGAPGGDTFKKRTPYKKVRAALTPHAPTSWYGKMKQAIGYEYGMGYTAIGWTSQTAANYGEIQEHGVTRQVTEAVRKKFAASGVPLKKDALTVPARPVFDPMTLDLRLKVPGFVENKLADYVAGKVVQGKKNRRKYKVHSV